MRRSSNTRFYTLKHFGSKFEFERQRNDDLYLAYRNAISNCRHIYANDLYVRIVNSPSVRFWVSEERAAIVISKILKGDKLLDMRPLKREMFMALFDAFCKLREQFPDRNISELAFFAVRQPAPKFYLTPGSAKVIICRIRKQWRNMRKRKY